MEKRLLEFRNLKEARKQGNSQQTKLRPATTQHGSEDSKGPTETAAENSLKVENSSDEERKFKVTMLKQKEKLGIINDEEKLSFWDKHIEKVLKFLLWGCLQGLFIQLGFGAVYFIVSLSYIMYASMTSRSGRQGLSAYSVFNKGFERIHGTFTAEQFENQLRHGTRS